MARATKLSAVARAYGRAWYEERPLDAGDSRRGGPGRPGGWRKRYAGEATGHAGLDDLDLPP